jgi:hypothetical protein
MKTLLLAILTGTLLTLSGCGGGGGGGTAGGGGGGGGTVTRRDASVRAAQGFLAFDRIGPSQAFIFYSGLRTRNLVDQDRGLGRFIKIAYTQVSRGGFSNEWFQDFDLGLWYQTTTVTDVTVRFEFRENPSNADTDAGTITVTKTSAPNNNPAYEVNLALTRGNFPMSGVLRLTYLGKSTTDGSLFADYSLATDSGPIRVQYDDEFDPLREDGPTYFGSFTITKGEVVTSLTNIENVNAFSRVIADFTAAGFTGSVTQETIDGSFTVFLQGEVVGQDWVITVDGNGSAVITPPNLPAEAPVSLLSL